jgi:hypothetical protein
MDRAHGRETIEIELHVQFYSNILIRRSGFALFDTGFAIQPALAEAPFGARLPSRARQICRAKDLTKMKGPATFPTELIWSTSTMRPCDHAATVVFLVKYAFGRRFI